MDQSMPNESNSQAPPGFVDYTSYEAELKRIHASASNTLTIPKCIFRCKNYRSLRFVPRDTQGREEWRQILKLSSIKRGEALCDIHFVNGQLVEFNGPRPKYKTVETEGRPKRCAKGCKTNEPLEKTPKDRRTRVLWSQKLNLKTILKRNQYLCGKCLKIGRTKRTSHIFKNRTFTTVANKVVHRSNNQSDDDTPSGSAYEDLVREVFKDRESPEFEVETLDEDEDEDEEQKEKEKSKDDDDEDDEESEDDEIDHGLADIINLEIQNSLKKDDDDDDDDFRLSWGSLEDEAEELPDDDDGMENDGTLYSLDVDIYNDEFSQNPSLQQKFIENKFKTIDYDTFKTKKVQKVVITKKEDIIKKNESLRQRAIKSWLKTNDFRISKKEGKPFVERINK